MKSFLHRTWREEDGVLSFEWTLLLTLLTIGIVSGLAAARDGVVDELGDVAQAMLAVDGSYLVSQPLAITVDPDGAGPAPAQPMGGGSDSSFTDAMMYTDCDRPSLVNGSSLGGQDNGFPVDDYDS